MLIIDGSDIEELPEYINIFTNSKLQVGYKIYAIYLIIID